MLRDVNSDLRLRRGGGNLETARRLAQEKKPAGQNKAKVTDRTMVYHLSLAAY